MGDAAAHVSEESRAKAPSVQWIQIIGMRNRLVHDYGQIDRDILWDTISADIPALTAALELLIGGRTAEDAK